MCILYGILYIVEQDIILASSAIESEAEMNECTDEAATSIQLEDQEDKIGCYQISELQRIFRRGGVIGETRAAIEYLHYAIGKLSSRVIQTAADSEEFKVTVEHILKAKPMQMTIVGFGNSMPIRNPPVHSSRIFRVLQQIQPHVKLTKKCMVVMSDLNFHFMGELLKHAKGVLEMQCTLQSCSTVFSNQAIGRRSFDYKTLKSSEQPDINVGTVYCCEHLHEGFELLQESVPCLNAEHIKSIIPTIFNGQLIPRILAKVDVSVLRFERARVRKQFKSAHVSLRKMGRLVFDPTEVFSCIKDIDSEVNMSESFLIATAATLEYITVDILHSAAANTFRISPQDVMLATEDDAELYELFKKIVIRNSSSVIPHIIKDFIPQGEEEKQRYDSLLMEKSILSKADGAEGHLLSLSVQRLKQVRRWQKSSNYLLPQDKFLRHLQEVSSKITQRPLIIDSEATSCLQSYVEDVATQLCEQAYIRFVRKKALVCTHFDMMSGWERKRLLLLIVDASFILNASVDDSILVQKRCDEERLKDLWRLIQASFQLPSLNTGKGILIRTLLFNVLSISGIVQNIASYLSYLHPFGGIGKNVHPYWYGRLIDLENP